MSECPGARMNAYAGTTISIALVVLKDEVSGLKKIMSIDEYPL